MSLQNPRVFPCTITTGNSLSTIVDMGGGYLFIAVEVPASGAAAAFNAGGGAPAYVRGGSTSTVARRVYEIYTNSVATAFTIQSSVSNAMVPVANFSYRYAQIEISGTVTGAGGPVTFNIVCTDSL